MSKGISLSIVMPCLNEAETLETCIIKAKEFLNKQSLSGEIIIADNGSTDGSQTIAENAGAKVVHVPVKGYGSALMGGIAAAQNEFIIMGDADDSYDFGALEPFVNALQKGADLVMGNRFKGGIMHGAMPFLHRYLGNPILSWLARIFFNSDIGDFHCGLRAFRKKSILSLNLQTTGMEFASEMVVKATMHNLVIVEVPTVLHPDGRSRPPHLRTWSDGWRHLKFLLLYSPRWLFLYPGIFLICLGILISALLVPGPVHIGKYELDINTLMYASLMILTGTQSILFSVFTYVFGVNTGLIPPDPTTKKILKSLELERGLFISLGMILIGLLTSIGALIYWGENQFGNIEPSYSMRFVIPGAVLFALGIQVFFSSFFLDILNIKVRHPQD